MRWLIYVAIPVAILGTSLLAREVKPIAATFYTVEASILEGDAKGSIKKGTLRALASPKVSVAESQEANILIGGCIGAQQVEFGTALKVKVERFDTSKVRVTGVLEISSAGAPSDDTVVRIAAAVHFAKTVACGERIRVPMSNAPNPGRWFELFVDEVPPETQRQSSTRQHSVNVK